MSELVPSESLRELNLKSHPEISLLLRRPSEAVDFRRRENQLDDLLSKITERRRNDKDSLCDLAGKVAYFLAGDPLSDQQAGSVARYLELTKEPSTRLTFEERKRLVVGDWGEIERILTANEMRASLWEGAKKMMAESQEQVKVYRRMDLGWREKIMIARNGLFPAGIYKYGSLEGLLQDMIYSFPTNPRYMLERVLLCKVNVLSETWVEKGEFGFSEQYRLGISTTTKENLENIHRFGSHLLEITIPQDRLIATARYDDPVFGSEDERTILYYVPPEAIKFSDKFFRKFFF